MGGNTKTVTDETFATEVLEADRPGARRLLGRVVRAVPPGRSGARGDRRRARRTSSRSPSSTSTRTPATARNYQVMSIPTMAVFSKGELVKTIVGARPKAAILRDLTDFVG